MSLLIFLKKFHQRPLPCALQLLQHGADGADVLWELLDVRLHEQLVHIVIETHQALSHLPAFCRVEGDHQLPDDLLGSEDLAVGQVEILLGLLFLQGGLRKAAGAYADVVGDQQELFFGGCRYLRCLIGERCIALVFHGTHPLLCSILGRSGKNLCRR